MQIRRTDHGNIDTLLPQQRMRRSVSNILPLTAGPVNVSEVERWLSLLGGGLLALYTLRRSLGTVVLLGGAGALLYRGLKGQCPLYQAMGLSTVAPDSRRQALAASLGLTSSHGLCWRVPKSDRKRCVHAYVDLGWGVREWGISVGIPPRTAADIRRSMIASKEKTMQTLWLLGGLGLGAGLMYLMDPEKGAERRDVVRGHVRDYGRETGDLFDGTRRTLGRQAQAAPRSDSRAVQTPAGAGGTAADASRGEGPAPWPLPPGLCRARVGLGYLLEPQGGPQRRAQLREKVRAYWHTTETLLSSAPGMERTLLRVKGGRMRPLRTRHEVPQQC